MNRFAKAANLARGNMGFGQLDDDDYRLVIDYSNLWNAVVEIMGEFAEGEDHINLFLGEANSWLDKS